MEKLQSHEIQGPRAEMSSSDDIANLDRVIELLSSYLKKSVYEATPKPKAHKHKSYPWWSEDLSKMRSENNTLRRKSQRHRNDKYQPSHQAYRKHHSRFKSAIRSAKWNDFKKFSTSCNDPWDFVKVAMKDKHQSTISIIKKDDGTFTKSISETASLLLNKFFPDDDPDKDTQKHKETRVHVNQYINEARIYDKVSPIQTSEMKEIFAMDPYKAAPDNILPVFYQKTYNTLLPFILVIFNRCLSLGTYPKSWKCATVQIHPKPKAKDQFYHKSYRPISLLPIMGKWFSKIVHRRLQWISETEHWINDKQFGFREGQSCEKALL